MRKIHYLWKALVATGFASLSGCTTAPVAQVPPAQTRLAQTLPPDAAPNPTPAVTAKPTLVAILWNMATTEKAALPEQILPYFGVTEVPPVKMLREDYGWFSIPYQPSRIVDLPLQSVGVASLSYSYNPYHSPLRQRNYYNIRPNEDSICVSAQEVIGVFGQTFKRLPARIRTAAVAISSFQVEKSIQLTMVEKGSLQFEVGLFDGRGSVTFQFDSRPCAEDIFINYTRKNQ